MGSEMCIRDSLCVSPRSRISFGLDGNARLVPRVPQNARRHARFRSEWPFTSPQGRAYSVAEGNRLPLATTIDVGSAEFAANAARMRALAAELRSRRAEAALGGPERIRERHRSRGKLLPRERVTRLLDPGAPFLELSPLAAFGMYDDAIHGAGLITVIG